MELLGRYLQAVRFWLPPGQKEDIAAELAEDIRSQIEAKQLETGLPLNDREVEAILKKMGSPLAVAERYLPQKSLIGPSVFPIYRLILRAAFLFYLLPWFAVWLIFLAVDPVYRSHSPFATLRTVWLASVHVFGFITIGCAVLDRIQARTKFLDQWNPGELPAVEDPNRIPRSRSIGDMVGAAVSLLWWTGVLRLPEIPSLTISLTAVWLTWYWAIVSVVLGAGILAAFNFIQPWWTKPKAAARLAVSVAEFALTLYLLVSGPWVFLFTSAVDPTRDATLWANQTVQATLVICLIYFGIHIVMDLRRMFGSAGRIVNGSLNVQMS